MHKRLDFGDERGGGSKVNRYHDDARDEATPIARKSFGSVFAPEHNRVAFSQTRRPEFLGEAPRGLSHLGIRVSTTSVAVVVDKKVRSNRGEIPEKVDQRVTGHVRIITRLAELGISPTRDPCRRSGNLIGAGNGARDGAETDYNACSMRIFLTGATGYVGSTVLDALLRASHDVSALVRDPEKAERVSLRGVHPIIGDLSVPASYAQPAEVCDAIIHTAYESSKRGPQVDRQAVDVLLGAAIRHAARGQHVSFVYTSAAWVLGNTSGKAAEDAPLRPTALVDWRPEQEKLVLEAGRGRTLRTAVVRPGIVYGGGRGIIAEMLKSAADGLVRVIGDGLNHWACVYDRDLADLYLRVATSPDGSGVFHATDEADERVMDIVEAVSRQAKAEPDVRHVPIEEARAKIGPYADALALNQIVRGPRARALGWTPSLHSITGSLARLLEEFRSKREAA